MIEFKSNRDVETFSKFLENGGTLPEEPPVSEARGHPPAQGCPQLLLDGDREGVCVHPCLIAAFSR